MAGTVPVREVAAVAWSIAEVAQMAKVTSRTLRHYDRIGLLAPASVGANGYRYYERPQLERLQEILLLRELGLDLDTIAQVLDGQRDRLEALRHHEQWLHAEQDRLDRLATTVARTIAQLQGGPTMSAKDLFEGFADRLALQEDFVDRYGEDVREHFRTALERTRGWTEEDLVAARVDNDKLNAEIVALMRSGAAPDSAEALDVVAAHYHPVAHFWTPNRQSYTGLGQLYVDDAQLRARHEAIAPGLAEYLRDAIAAYASHHPVAGYRQQPHPVSLPWSRLARI